MTGDLQGVGKIALDWWRSNLRPPDENGAVRGFRARLRRADSVVEVFTEPRVIELYDELKGRFPRDPHDLAALAQVLAAVEVHTSQPIARAFGKGDDNPALSRLRFRNLILIEERPKLGVALRAALPLIGHACDVAALSRDFLCWNEKVRTDWCLDYFPRGRWEAPPPEAAKEDME